MSTHEFESTGEAYDACQTDDNIKTGDTLVVAPERVVGLAWTWPVAVTREHGALHTVRGGDSPAVLYDYDNRRVFTDEQIEAAEQLAEERGWR